ncbi:signal peptidase I [Aequitasia blattaphilus]|uniref:Signal peptidase I n=1 Tax=Aequitasia blattaphilus TaxID=2949332 RepID=A0ABT1E702_9FIRM|nr:signal peptidase I [Aequitasia blattaphilus]MCP1101607.1 signal peptidase I [Aequitasia blattaphilus]MCR8614247.1 signal peptidase I [Aequitasia blattaphilus]
MSEKKKKSVMRELLGWIIYVGIIIVITYLIITFVGVRTRVSGHSMETTLSDGDNLIVDKISYRFRDPSRFDIIVFPYPQDKKIHYIKRIVGLPGETIQIIDGETYINNQRLESDIYGYEKMTFAGTAEDGITLGEDEYFVLGDNRNHSADSRYPNVGVLHKEDMTGKAWIRIYPFNKFGVIKHE